MCDHCGCRQGAIAELMDQHDAIKALGTEVRQLLADGDEPAARMAFGDLLAILRPHVSWEEAGLFARVTAQGDFADHVASLEAEHASLYRDLENADLAPFGWKARILAILDDLDRHIYREDFGLFPGAISVLGPDDWDAIDRDRPVAS
jgi:hemerythrin-like domain-containing protein